LIGVLVPPSLQEAVLDGFRSADTTAHDGRTSAGLVDGITVLTGEASKGLEFDATVVVEPRLLVEEHPAGQRAGYRTLFVALTRATQRVVVVHAAELPPELLGPARTTVSV
jgi:DNA helicase IV